MSIVVLLDTSEIGVGAATLAGVTANGAGLAPRYLDPGSIDAAIPVNGVGALELVSTVGITQFIDLPSIDASSTPVGGWLFGGT